MDPIKNDLDIDFVFHGTTLLKTAYSLISQGKIKK